MHKRSSTFGLDQERLAQIWSIGSNASADNDKADQHPEAGELLRDYLARCPPLDPELTHLLPQVLRRLWQELQPFVGESFESLLLDTETDIEAINRIKDAGKTMVRGAKSEAEHQAATAIYYAAIASAMVSHQRRITSLSNESLSRSFADLAENRWLTAELRDLFGKAQEMCQARAGRPQAED